MQETLEPTKAFDEGRNTSSFNLTLLNGMERPNCGDLTSFRELTCLRDQRTRLDAIFNGRRLYYSTSRSREQHSIHQLHPLRPHCHHRLDV